MNVGKPVFIVTAVEQQGAGRKQGSRQALFNLVEAKSDEELGGESTVVFGKKCRRRKSDRHAKHNSQHVMAQSGQAREQRLVGRGVLSSTGRDLVNQAASVHRSKAVAVAVMARFGFCPKDDLICEAAFRSVACCALPIFFSPKTKECTFATFSDATQIHYSSLSN